MSRKRPEIRVWNAGVADEAWKRDICRREILDLECLIQKLGYLIFKDIDGASSEEILSALEQASGAQIAEALRAYRQSRMDSIDAGESK